MNAGPSAWPRLREPQDLGIAAVRAHWASTSTKGAALVLPTGVGKTITGLTIARQAVRQGKRVLWTAPSKQLTHQPLDTLEAHDPWLRSRCGVVQGKHDGHDAPMVFACTGTLFRESRRQRMLDAGAFDVVVVDEMHHAEADQHRGYLDHVVDHATAARGVAPNLLGLTATIERADKRTFGSRWEVVYSYQLTEAIDAGYLVPPRFVRGAMRSPRSEREEDQLEAVAASIADNYLELGEGRRAMGFTPDVRVAQRAAKLLRDAGVAADWVAGQGMSDTEQARRVTAHQRGELRVLINAQLLIEGYDDRSLDCLILSRAFDSKSLYLQALGRGLRTYPGKEDCLVLDLTGVSDEHELVQAAYVLEEERKAASSEDGGEQGAEGEGAERPSRYQAMFSARERSTYHWVTVRGLDRAAFAISVMGKGSVVLVEQDLQHWDLWHFQQRGDPRRVVARPVDVGMAMSLGEDLVRRWSSPSLVKKARKWREQPASAKQIAALQKWRVRERPETSGEAGDLLTEAATRAALVRHRLARRA